MKKISLYSALIFAACFSLYSCVSVTGSSNYNQDPNQLTVGKVQQQITKGMSGAEVIQALGSPNIITKDENGKETWVYDKIATQANYTENSSALILFLYNRGTNESSYSVSQKTLTVVIKLNDDQKVESFSYHASNF